MASLEGQILTQWAGKATLNGLLASTAVYIGDIRDVDPPYCQITRESAFTQDRMSGSARVDVVNLRFMIFHSSHVSGAAIRDELMSDAGFDNNTFDVASNGAVIVMRHENNFELQDDNGIWSFVTDFEVAHQLPA